MSIETSQNGASIQRRSVEQDKFRYHDYYLVEELLSDEQAERFQPEPR